MVYTPNFLKAADMTLGVEKGLSNHRNDPGKRTMWGITERDFPEAWKDGPPSRKKAVEIYFEHFWRPCRLDEVRSFDVAFEVFDTAINCGPVAAVKFLQAVANKLSVAMGMRAIAVDGKMGTETLRRVNALIARDREEALIVYQNILQGMHYWALSNSPTMDDFLAGWNKRLRLPARMGL